MIVVISNLYDRKSLELVSSRILSTEKKDNDKFYEPLVEAIYNNMMNEQDSSAK